MDWTDFIIDIWGSKKGTLEDSYDNQDLPEKSHIFYYKMLSLLQS